MSIRQLLIVRGTIITISIILQAAIICMHYTTMHTTTRKDFLAGRRVCYVCPQLLFLYVHSHTTGLDNGKRTSMEWNPDNELFTTYLYNGERDDFTCLQP